MNSTLVLALGVGAIFVGIGVAILALAYGGGQRAAVGRSLAAIDALDQAGPDLRANELERPFGERVMSPSLARVSDLGRRFTPADQTDRIRRRLTLAGNPEGWDVDRVLAYKVLGMVILGILGFAVPRLVFDASWLITLVVAIGGVVLGYFLPNLVLYQMGYNRSEQILKELPDALDLLTISVEAGLAFDAALAQVAKNTQGPLAEEFFRVLSEMQIGRGRSEALRDLGERTDVDDLRSFVTAMVQADSFGIPIANVLRVQAREMRIKRRQRAEEKAQQVPVKILFPLIFCILPALFIIIIGPAVISIVRNFAPAF